MSGAPRQHHHNNRDKGSESESESISSVLFDEAISSRDPATPFFPDLVPSDDPGNRPLSVCLDGDIFLETFSAHYKSAYDFLITLFSMYAAVSIGLGVNEIIRVLTLLSKCKISDALVHKIFSTIKAVGKLLFVLENNRFLLNRLMLRFCNELRTTRTSRSIESRTATSPIAMKKTQASLLLIRTTTR
jgi:hypothetical protein